MQGNLCKIEAWLNGSQNIQKSNKSNIEIKSLTSQQNNWKWKLQKKWMKIQKMIKLSCILEINKCI
jgi:hypothetical protein